MAEFRLYQWEDGSRVALVEVSCNPMTGERYWGIGIEPPEAELLEGYDPRDQDGYVYPLPFCHISLDKRGALSVEVVNGATPTELQLMQAKKIAKKECH